MKKLLIAAAAAWAGTALWAASGEGAASQPADGEKKAVVAEESDDARLLSVEAGVRFDSKYLSYGFVDARDPILTPNAAIGFWDDLLKFDMAWLMDTTHNSRKYGYGNRRWQYFEADFGATLDHTFTTDEFDWLPTAVELSLNYMYEYHPRRAKCKNRANPGHNVNPDTQFWTFEAKLPEVWFEPHFTYERDVMRDDGTYLNFEIGHEFALVDAGSADVPPELGLDLRLAQGFGNEQRVKGYLVKEDGEPLDHAGLMDTSFVVTLNWRPVDWLTVAPYVGYWDFLFDRKIRDGARIYEPSCTGGHRKDTSYHFVAGFAVSASF